MNRIVPCLFLLAACGDDGGSSTGADAAVQGSCFYSCNTSFGTLYGCTSNASITSSATCSTNADTQCGSDSVGRSELVATCEACGSSCAPEWHDPPTATIDAPSQTFPAVCQELPLSCPDAASLATCEMHSAAAFGTCSYLPITAGCATAGCPSEAQICRTAESSAGHCTHSCVDDDDCVVAGGGSATCTTINGVVKICTVD